MVKSWQVSELIKRPKEDQHCKYENIYLYEICVRVCVAEAYTNTSNSSKNKYRDASLASG